MHLHNEFSACDGSKWRMPAAHHTVATAMQQHPLCVCCPEEQCTAAACWLPGHEALPSTVEVVLQCALDVDCLHHCSHVVLQRQHPSCNCSLTSAFGCESTVQRALPCAMCRCGSAHSAWAATTSQRTTRCVCSRMGPAQPRTCLPAFCGQKQLTMQSAFSLRSCSLHLACTGARQSILVLEAILILEAHDGCTIEPSSAQIMHTRDTNTLLWHTDRASLRTTCQRSSTPTTPPLSTRCHAQPHPTRPPSSSSWTREWSHIIDPCDDSCAAAAGIL